MNHLQHLNFMSQLGFALGSGRIEEANAMATGKKHITSKVVDVTLPADGRITPELGARLTQIAIDTEPEEQEEWDKANAQDPYDGGRL